MALTKINTNLIAVNTIAASNIADNALDSTKIASNSILTRHIDDNQITTDQIAENTIATANIADNAVDSTKIAQNSILTRHIDDDQVTGDQLADNLTIAGTLASTGVLTANAGVVVDNITIDGTEIDLSSGDLTLDVAGDIILDADGADIKFYHAGSHWGSLYTNATPQHLYLQNMVSDGDIIFAGNDGGSSINALILDMSAGGNATFNQHAYFGDSGYLVFGAGEDLKIHHDGSNSYITDAGTGALLIASNDFQVVNAAASENMILAAENGAVTLYYDNSAKLATASGGVTVTGTLGAGATTLTGNLTMMSNVVYASQAYVHDRLGHLNDADTYIDFGVDTITFAAGGERMRIDSSGNVGIGETSPDNLLHIKSSASDVTMIKLENTNAGAYPGRITFVQNSASPADDDALGKIDFYGEDSAGNSDRYAFILALNGYLYGM